MNNAPKSTATQTIDLGNAESVTRGVFPQADGTFLAMTYTRSRTFKTEAGALRWLARNGGPVESPEPMHHLSDLIGQRRRYGASKCRIVEAYEAGRGRILCLFAFDGCEMALFLDETRPILV